MDVLYSMTPPKRAARPPPKVSAPAQITQIYRFQPIGSGMAVLYSMIAPKRAARPPLKVSAPAQITQIDSNQ